MLIVFIILGCILFFFVLSILLAYFIHRKAFGKRWDPDGIVKYYALEDFSSFESEEVVISYKKIKLRGFLYSYPQSCYKGIVVFSHGMWGSHRAYLQEIEHLAKAGYKVLGFDYRGTELSDGKSIGGLGNSLASLDSAINYIRKNYPNEKIFVMGHSWGGFAAISIAKYHPNLAGIVSMSPFLNERRILRTMLPKALFFLIPFLLIIDALNCGTYSLTNAIKVLKKTKVQTLILHSTDDNMIPFNSSTEYLMHHIENKNITYKIVEGKRHNPDYSLEALQYTTQAFENLSKLKTKEERQEFRKTMDYHKMGELDEEIFHYILQFLNSL